MSDQGEFWTPVNLSVFDAFINSNSLMNENKVVNHVNNESIFLYYREVKTIYNQKDKNHDNVPDFSMRTNNIFFYTF